ncbi:MAG: aminotransferase DegT [Candidatus Levybacteria bacterium RIFCSPHIGHO2_02_FULL_40_18]|nr:MAG: aminotransferase DegT [Candidatus Levybacteria bacterium RIFCSPHIGHO2_01_FULL_40_58]OGH27177.1 MAG: aminotransferase DegT [Candidatus Levybacteria bacterium RIFCSPHIGHO2_02_FULL_40_18]OGH31036.1 MAG: aminotransferase DegT [Candidatus Levybacteria bacterium RIFCSPHIGHO2_12_FULL_40_31]OGH41047.1 MAG: aminotransferase DegT [Candidatus Levybacteria bacterium RIFCSPLOWO2_01_FULL_40_64]OGH49433.1 MAG: aminotransferase DegT [Candidatus Levybacteria bacterium RIFCSPLOWO2_02_FULL_41_11]
MITVTKTYLPPIKEYIKYVEEIWKSGFITNHSKYVLSLEKKLKKYLEVKHLFFVSNGTTALQIAIRALDLKDGEIITTPFSYVASTSSIVWEHCRPIFVDIDPGTLTIDVKKIQKAITSKTKAILAVHVYGNSCDVEAIGKIAKKNKLKIIYDAAHAFGVKYKKIPLVNFGDISILSFHATKIFHTVEGGAITTSDDQFAHKISYMRNFGHNGEESFFGLGINGKNTEFHAAMGLAILPKVKTFISRRRKLSKLYDEALKRAKLTRPGLFENLEYNYSYYPVIFESESELLRVKNSLNKHNIFPRRYFYPSLNTLNYVKKYSCPVSEDIARRIMCLPLYESLSKEEVNLIAKLIIASQKEVS